MPKSKCYPQGSRAQWYVQLSPIQTSGFRGWMPELESSHLGDCGEVPSARVCKCSISIHRSCSRIYGLHV